MKELGKVYLVGAGPGSADLLTVRARRLLEECDCVVYDRLVGKEILSMIPLGKECIDVGKSVGRHAVLQEEINGILIREAKLGKKVARLKGGDPFLFGRGGEEAEALIGADIPFEVVPGVSSSIAVPAYNGIPVTHRDYVSSVHIITGHHKDQEVGRDKAIPYDALVKTEGTLVFLMGVAALEEILEGLRGAGMDADMPAAILQQGTTARQRKIVATVGTLAAEARRRQIKAPSVIVVGEVCGLSEKFEWYEKLPLFGQKIVVTRPQERGEKLQEQLKALGAEVLSIPVIRTVRIGDEKRLRAIGEELDRLEQYQALAFTSPYGVERFFEILLESGRDIRAVSHMKFAVIGQGTADALLRRGIKADYMPRQYDGISLGKLLADVLEDGTRILFARSLIGAKEVLREIEENRTLEYTDLAIYDTEFTEENKETLRSAMGDGTVTCVVFTSSSAVEGFCRFLGEYPYDTVRAACIGEKTRQAADKAGMRAAAAKNATVEELIKTVGWKIKN